MKIYTSRIGTEGLDITVKSGDKVFAPSWEIVLGLKDGKITWQQYVERYTKLMRKSYKNNTKRWMEVINQDKVILLCYCANPDRCHRSLLKDMLIKVAEFNGIEAEYLGEI
jgi:uncharacterized protein YeaO (DUF488 family)